MRDLSGPGAWITRHCFPLWALPRSADTGRGLYLPGVKTFVYTAAASGRQWAPYAWRRQRVRQIMAALGFSDWQFFFGKRADAHWHGREPYWWQIPLDHAELLRREEPPLLILEDDIELEVKNDFRAEWKSNLELPAGCDFAYLGGFRSGDRRGIRNARLVGLRPLEAWRYGYLPIDGDWMRVFGMWGSHAILHVDKGVMLDLAEQLVKKHRPIDTTLAVLQWRWRVCCLRRPFFWQNDGHHRHDTVEYDFESRWEPGRRRRAGGGKGSRPSP